MEGARPGGSFYISLTLLYCFCMNRSKGLKQVRRVAKRIAQEYQPEKIILFGSYAWGKPTRDSDFDLLVIKRGKRDFFRDHNAVHDVIDGEIAADVLVYSPQSLARRVRLGDFFFQDIVKKGKVLYERKG